MATRHPRIDDIPKAEPRDGSRSNALLSAVAWLRRKFQRELLRPRLRSVTRVTYPHGDATIEVLDPCMLINLYGERPFVTVFDEEGRQTRKQFANAEDAAKALIRVHGGGLLDG